ncbi:T9SS type B sorting domain-containing protein [Flavobacterium sp.]|uniref:T9SS type B sorting domain-containing protein n=1 Tax=Flavobacterium sp. TaxID=239 RepID=UPI0026062BEA|nr:T9SS type B sorting domain-containing protein [Flavobacterium sp.]MDG2431867.1 T9SS type B sorting domain-containing protein [Flavobacterium sp.]
MNTNSGTDLVWDVYAKDANGCITFTTINVVRDPLPGVSVVVDNQCTGSGSSFTITATPTAASLTPVSYGIGGPTGAFQTNPTFTVPAGTYTVYIKDKNGCTAAATPITVYPKLSLIGAGTKTLDCNTAGPNATITTTITGGKANYNYTIANGVGTTVATGSGITGPTITYTGAAADTYTVSVTDANSCSATTTITVAPITLPTVTAVQINVSCNAGSDGSVTLTGAGGSGGYTYSSDNSTYVSTATFSGLAAGTYTFYVKDSKSCTGAVSVTITQPANALAATVVEVPFSCSTTNAKVAGTITINATAGTAPYTYSLNGGAFTGSNVLTLNDNGSDQDYTYTVKDAKGCLISGLGKLLRLNPPTDLDFVPSGPITCSTTSISVQLTATAGVAPLAYSIVSGPVVNATGASTGNFTGLTPGTYVFRVIDANGCYYSESYTIAPVTPIVATATKLTDVDCFGNSTGSIRYNVSGFGSGTYSYTVNGGAPVTGQTASNFNLTGLAAGTYAVVFTDNTTTCTSSTSITINQPAAALSATYTTVNANCNIPTARVTVTVAGGTASYRYSFVTSSTTPGTYGASNVANLNPTTSTSWYAHIIDANNCTFRLPITIASDPTPTVTASAAGQCLGAGTYTITANNTTTPVSGIVTPITYSINNGASYQAVNTFTVTTAGTYIILMKDGNGCIATSNTVTVNPRLTLSAVLDKDITCSLPAAAQITLNAVGGNGSYTYTSSPATGTFAGNVFTTSTPDSYTFTVTDTSGNSCTASTTTAIVITTPVKPDITGIAQTQTIKCNGDATGAFKVTIDATQGVAPFQYSIDGTTFQTSDTFTGLVAGTYTVTLRDAKGCIDTDSIIIAQPTPIFIDLTVIPIQCGAAGLSKGSIIINKITDGVSTVGGSGGTPGYTYYVTGINGYNMMEANPTGDFSTTFDVVDFGFYQIRVVDANGCQQIINDVLVASDPKDLDIVINSTVDCTTGGTATVKVAGPLASSGPFHFNIYNGPGQVWTADGTAGWQGESPAGSKGTTFTGLLPGVTYTFIVYDEATNCYYYETAATPVPSNSSLTVANVVPKNITCTGSADGNVSFDVANSSAASVDYTYEIFEAFTNISQYLSGTFTVAASSTVTVPNIPITLGVGSYYVYVRETSGPNAGCGNTSINFSIKESPVLLSVTATLIKNSNCTDQGIISAEAKDGTGPYMYQVTTSATPPLASDTNWVSGNTFTRPGSIAGILYYVYAKDAYGCIKFDTVTVFADAEPTINTPAPICYDGTDFTITISGTVDPAVVGAATYSINGSAFQTSTDFTFNAAATYNLVIKDGNGCTANIDYIVYPQLAATATLTKPLDCTATPDAEIRITTTGGNTNPTASYTYEVSFNGAANVAALNPYTATAAGTYVFTVTDANNATSCTTTASITLDAIPVPTLTPTLTDVSCNGDSDGTITVDVTGGVGPFTYTLASTPANTTGDASGIYTGLSYGTTYEVTVTDSNGCTYLSGPLTVDEPAILTATDTFTPNTSCSTTTVITVSANGGTPSGVLTGYTYNFEGLGYTTDNTYTVNNTNTATTVNYTVKDANGCETASKAVITPALTPPTDLDFVVTTAPTCPANTATVEVTATGGLGALDFDILSFNGTATTLYPTVTTAGSGTAASFAGLPPGDYVFQVTDENGCTYQELFTVVAVTPIAIVSALVNDITCNPANAGTANGSATFTVTGFSSTGNYSIAVTSVPAGLPFAQTASGDVITLTGLSVGTYTVTVTDNTTLCEADASITITEPDPIDFTLTATKVYCSQYISQITVSGVTGGTGIYSYAVVAGGAVAPTAYSNSSIRAVDTSNGTILTWDVYVKDANGCIAIRSVTIDNNVPPTITAPVAQCFVGSALTVDLDTVTSVYGGTKFYTVDGVALATSTATFTAAGTYVLGIKDDNGCEAFVNYTIQPQLLANAVLTKDLYCAAPINATIDVTISGGVGPYTVQTILNGVPTGAPVSAVAGPVYSASVGTVGTYSFTISDSASPACSVTTNTVEVTTPATPTFTSTKIDVTCNGGADGTITFTAANGVAPYSYVLSGTGTNNSGDSSGVYSGLPAGSYTVVVTDAKGCTSAAATAITISEPAVVSASISVTTGLSCGAGNATQAATVTALGAGGTGPYQFNFNGQGFTSSNTFVTNSSGTVSVIAKDANGCTFATAVTTIVDALDPPVITGITGTPIYCLPISSQTSTVTVATSNGVGTLSYAILEPASATTNTSGASSGVFDSLAAGTYLFQVTDANGCTDEQYYTVDDVVNITVTGQVESDVACKGDSTGAVSFTVDNFVSTYSYTINGGSAISGQSAAVISLTGLAVGSQQIVVTDETSLCTATFTVTVSEPAIALSVVATLDKNANCNTGAVVSAVASNGTAGYTYAFALASAGAPAAGDYTAASTVVLDPLLGINWIAYTKDANGCIAQDAITLLIDPLPTITSLPNVCFQGAPITITINGSGVGPLQYSIGNGYQPSADFVLNAAGTYQLYVQDANGCIVQETYTLLPQLLLDATLTQDLTCDVDASITLTASQGSAPYTLYEVTTDGTTFTAITAPVSPYVVTVDGTYQFRVTDSQGCQALSQAVIVTAKTSPTFSTTKTDVTCIGGNNGVITVTAANGIAPYSYAINGGTPQSSNVFPNLVAGTYTIEVKDAKGCFPATQDVIIAEPTAIAANIAVTTALSCGAGNATQAAVVTVTVTTGTGTAPYQYSFDGGANYQDDNTFTTSTAGTVTAYVRDANGCNIAAPVSVDVDALDPPVITGITGTPIYCLPIASQTSTVTVATSNGVGTLSFAILEPASATTNTSGASSGVFNMLAAGTYLFQVTDANGCTDEQYYTVDDVVNITVTGQVIKNVACVGDANGEIEFKVANYSGTYSVALSPSSGTLSQSGDTVTVTGLLAGTYTLRVTDNVTNCFSEATVIVNEPTALNLTEVLNVNATCTTDARVTVAANGGTPPYLYAFVPSTVTPVSTDYTDATTASLDKTIANWNVYVKDNNNCVTILPVVIATDPLPSGITISGLSQCPSATNDYTFTVNVASGVGPYQYSIGAGFQTSPSFTVTNTGVYNVTVKDANECEVIIPALVSILAPLDLSAIVTTLPSCNVNDGVVDATVSGGSGSGNYQFSIDGGTQFTADSYSFTGLAPGLHTVLVRDVVTGCTDQLTVNLESATIVTGLSLATTPVSCFGGNNGSITATIATPSAGINDNPVYTYALNGTTVGGATVTVVASPSNVFDDLQAGTYTVTVTSARGCTATATIDVVEPVIITVPAPVVTQFACVAGTNASNYASISVSNVAGGSGTYVIYEFIKGSTVVQRGPETVYIESNYAGGLYTVNVYDTNNCVGSTTNSISIAAYTALDKISVIVDRPITCNNLEDITATAVDAAGNPITGIQYTLVDDLGTISVVNSTGVFTNLNIGNYIITALTTATNCSVQTVHYINEPNTFILQAVKTADVVCFGSNEGAATITLIDTQTNPMNDAGAFTYTVSGPTPSSGTSAVAGPLNLTGLTAGEYTITARLDNTPFCTVSTIFSINQPVQALEITETHTAITCIAGNNDGSIVVTATGGWPGEYQYEVLKDGFLFSPYSDKTDYNDLVAGSYTINVKDSKGCVDSVIVDLVVPTPISLTVTPATQLLLCLGDETGTVEATMVNGGQGSNYTYTLNYLSLNPVVSSGPQQSPLFANLGAGSYSITVTDGYNCSTESASVVINEPTEVKADLVLSRTPTCLSSAQITLTASGGTAPYRYSADNINFIPFTSGGSTTLNVGPGTYSYYVKDSNDCVAFLSNDIEVEAVPVLTVALDLSNAKVNCFNDDKGVIVAKATGGLGNYVYTLYNGSGLAIIPAPTQSVPGRFDGLRAGFYQVRVQSGSDCSVSSAVEEVKQPVAPISFTPTITNVSCFGGNDGRIEIVATGGTGQIIYSISPDSNQFFTTGVFDKLAAGNYQIVIQDEAGCYETYNFRINEPPILRANLVANSIIPEICSGDKDGSFSIEIQGGTAPYKVSLDNRTGTYTQGTIGQSEFDFIDISGGKHTVYFVDAAGCNSEIEVILPDAVLITPVADLIYDCVDNKQANRVIVTYDNSNDPVDLDFDLDGSGNYQASNVFNDLAPGSHFINVRHTNGCTQSTIPFTVDAVAPLSLVIADGDLNQIKASAAGGAGGYEYSFDGESFSNQDTFVFYKSGNYTVIVRDKNGCTATVNRDFTYIDICIPNYFTPNDDTVMDTWAPGCTINYPNLTFAIFDRYGREIARLRLGDKWDGKYKGAELPSGDYWYVLKLNNNKDDREFVGHFTLYR